MSVKIECDRSMTCLCAQKCCSASITLCPRCVLVQRMHARTCVACVFSVFAPPDLCGYACWIVSFGNSSAKRRCAGRTAHVSHHRLMTHVGCWSQKSLLFALAGRARPLWSVSCRTLATKQFKEHAMPTEHTLLPFTYLNFLSRRDLGQKGLVQKHSSFA